MKNFVFLATAVLSLGILIGCSKDDEKDSSEQQQTYTMEAIDLGLSVKWANMNVGATAPWEVGNYYAWGETSPKQTYTKNNYNAPPTGPVIGTQYDAARVVLGEPWRMPTEAEWRELLDNCKRVAASYWDRSQGSGVILYGPNNIRLFLPRTGYKGESANHENSCHYRFSANTTVTFIGGMNLDDERCLPGQYVTIDSNPYIGYVIRAVQDK